VAVQNWLLSVWRGQVLELEKFDLKKLRNLRLRSENEL
jgi:hypothetical protein